MANNNVFGNCKSRGAVIKAFLNAVPNISADESANFNKQFKTAWVKCRDTVSSRYGKLYAEKCGVSAPAMLEVLYGLSALEGVGLYVEGSWVYVCGNTRPLAADLKSMGLRFSGKRQCWYLNPLKYAEFLKQAKKSAKAEKSA